MIWEPLLTLIFKLYVSLTQLPVYKPKGIVIIGMDRFNIALKSRFGLSKFCFLKRKRDSGIFLISETRKIISYVI